MNDCKVAIKRLDVAWNFIVTVPVINFRKGSFEHLSSSVNVEVELQSVEMACGNDEFDLPVFECCIVVLFSQCNGLEECQVWHVDVLLDHQLVQIDELNFDDFDGFSAS